MLMRATIIKGLQQYDKYKRGDQSTLLLGEYKGGLFSRYTYYDPKGIRRFKEITQYKTHPKNNFALAKDELYEVINILLDFTYISQIFYKVLGYKGDVSTLGYEHNLYSLLTWRKLDHFMHHNQALFSQHPGLQASCETCFGNSELIFWFPVSDLVAEFGEKNFSALLDLKKSYTLSIEAFFEVIASDPRRKSEDKICDDPDDSSSVFLLPVEGKNRQDNLHGSFR